MSEAGYPIADQRPHNVSEYMNDDWDYVITVCDHAKETCPVFHGNVKHQIHMGYEDPSKATGSYEHVLNEFRRIRDDIDRDFFQLYCEMEERK